MTCRARMKRIGEEVDLNVAERGWMATSRRGRVDLVRVVLVRGSAVRWSTPRRHADGGQGAPALRRVAAGLVSLGFTTWLFA